MNDRKLAEGKQKIMLKFTKLIMKRLYNVDVYVFFYDFFPEHHIRAIFRDKDTAPAGNDIPSSIEIGVGNSEKHSAIWNEKHKCSITFDSRLYRPDFLAPHAWDTIVHEATHYEEGILSKDNWEQYHSKKFKKIFKQNLIKIEDLRKKFNREVGWEENFVYEEDEELP